jgi:hypothetical protein
MSLRERRCHALSIASLVIALTYLLLIVVGAFGALFLVIWLFGETASEARTKSETARSTRNANFFSEESKLSTPTEIELPEDRAA